MGQLLVKMHKVVGVLRVPKNHTILVGQPVRRQSHNAGEPELSLPLRAKGT